MRYQIKMIIPGTTIDVDIFSLTPAIFATILSIFNWYQLRKPANIRSHRIISYGFISSEYHGGYQFCIPLILHNSGSNPGLVTNISIRFIDNDESTELDILGRAKLNEVNINQMYNFDWDSFEEEGYSMILPTYPVEVGDLQSRDILLIAQTTPDKIILDKEIICEIVVSHDLDATTVTSFPFILPNEYAEVDNSLNWYSPMPSS